MFCVGGEVKLWFCFLLLERKYWFIWRKWKWLRKLPHMSEKNQTNVFPCVFLITSATIKPHLFSSCCCASYNHKRQTMNIHFFCHHMTWFSCLCLFGNVLWKQRCLLQPIPRWDLWHCQLYLLLTSSVRALHRYQIGAVSFQTGRGKYCNVFLMLQFQRKLESLS